MYSGNLSTFYGEIFKAAGGWGTIVYRSVSQKIFVLLSTEAYRYFLPPKPVEEARAVIVTRRAELDHDGA
jgi:hypothetical protein